MKINSPYSKKFNDEYYRLAQIAKNQQNQYRQSSQLPLRENRFYTIDPNETHHVFTESSHENALEDDLENLRVSVPENPF